MGTHIYKKGALVRVRSYYDDERHRMDREREAGRTITASEYARRLVDEMSHSRALLVATDVIRAAGETP